MKNFYKVSEVDFKKLQENLKPFEIADESSEALEKLLEILTPANLEMVIYEARLLKIDSITSLELCVGVIFEAATRRECQEIFAVLVTKLEWSSVHICKETQKMITFREQLRLKAQNEIENFLEKQTLANGRQQSIDDEITDDEGNNQKSCLKKLRRPVALFRFIGQLYLMDFLPTTLMQQCVPALLDEFFCNENTLETLCALLKIVGKKLEISNSVNLAEEFAKLEARKAQAGISPHTRFMIEEVLAMRANRWEPVNEIDFIELYNLFLCDVEEKLYGIELWFGK